MKFDMRHSEHCEFQYSFILYSDTHIRYSHGSGSFAFISILHVNSVEQNICPECHASASLPLSVKAHMGLWEGLAHHIHTLHTVLLKRPSNSDKNRA
jgi:hypothetical protein